MGSGTSEWVETIVVAAIVGLLVGSFLNVVVYRVPRHMSVMHPPSHCPACDARLGGLDLVPVVSWLALRAKCRRCGAPISARYPIVELSTGVLLAGLAVALHWPQPLPSASLAATAALAAVVIDADGVVVPWPVALTGAVGAVSLGAVSAALDQPGRVGWAALGAVVAGGCTVAAERRNGASRWRAAVVVGTLGWVAGWLWPPGGAHIGGWVAVAGAATVAPANRRVPLGVLCAGGLAAILAGAVLGRP